jgi:hypothetical protein
METSPSTHTHPASLNAYGVTEEGAERVTLSALALHGLTPSVVDASHFSVMSSEAGPLASVTLPLGKKGTTFLFFRGTAAEQAQALRMLAANLTVMAEKLD